MKMSATSDDSIENIDFGGRFARQFFNNNWPNIEGDVNHHLHMLNPTSSTPVASDNSICDSGYESFGGGQCPPHRKLSTSPPINPNFQHQQQQCVSIGLNNNGAGSSCNSTEINTSFMQTATTQTNERPVMAVANSAAANLVDTNTTSISAPPSLTTTKSTSPISNNNQLTCLNHQQQLIIAQRQTSNNQKHGGTINIEQDTNNNIIISSPSTQPMKSHHQQHISDVEQAQQRHNQTSPFQSSRQTSLNTKSCCNPSTSASANHNQSSSTLTADELAKLSANIGLMKLIMTPDVVVRQQRSNSLFTTTPAVANSFATANPWSSHDVYQRFSNVDKIERAASLHRTAASYSEPQYTWSGQLPSRSYKNPVYSCKVFLGGVPWDVTEQGLIETFGRFGPLRVQWPGKDARQQSGQTKAGYVYLIYESERCVKALLQACTQDFGAGHTHTHPEKYYYQLSSRRMRFKEVQVIPWIMADSNYIRSQSGRPDAHRTVFVGALHGMLTAEGLAKIMNDLFGGIAYVGIDSDKHKYPIGSGRATFNNHRSYMKAVSAAFIEVKCSQFCKKIQVDPYLEPKECSTCHIQNGPIFCRDCLRYFCKTCWNWHHSTESIVGRQHRPLMRKKRET